MKKGKLKFSLIRMGHATGSTRYAGLQTPGDFRVVLLGRQFDYLLISNLENTTGKELEFEISSIKMF